MDNHNEISSHAMKIKISPSNYGVQQCTHSYAGYLGTPVILLTKSLFGSNNIFLYYLFQHMAFSLWDFSANITLPPSIPGLISIVTPSCHRVLPPRFLFFPQGLFFSRHVLTSCTSISPHKHQQVLSIFSIRILSQHSKPTCINGYSITKFILCN